MPIWQYRRTPRSGNALGFPSLPGARWCEQLAVCRPAVGGLPPGRPPRSSGCLRLAEQGLLSGLVWIAFHLASALTACALDKWCRPVQVKSILTFASGVTGL